MSHEREVGDDRALTLTALSAALDAVGRDGSLAVAAVVVTPSEPGQLTDLYYWGSFDTLATSAAELLREAEAFLTRQGCACPRCAACLARVAAARSALGFRVSTPSVRH